ncbi:mannitol dehydrogenase family protein [Saccharopolyspora sp. ASAGF58]|uniref:mannitol dehydrogenase family protein n=1 Tax=Saccharopolyspora sp. ASAGF58 TaxID=2719023 RepID=UPI001B30FABD|nr:mannitol dehydrogenase family protein [Saccharopolyspora sp. ASAGF58]
MPRFYPRGPPTAERSALLEEGDAPSDRAFVGAVDEQVGCRRPDPLHVSEDRSQVRAQGRHAGLQVARGEGVDPAAVVELLAREDIRVITLTVTEKGYRHDPATGDLDLADHEVLADLTDRPPRTVVGQLVRGLQRRAGTGAGPVTVVSCDNLPANGRTLRRLVQQFIDAAGLAELAAWVSEHMRFPATMVDRIVPATTADDLTEVRTRTGLRDEAAVVAEPFRQWVIEDDFAAARPPWELAGAVLVADVEPWEALKLRVLNASHSMLAYLSLACRHATIAEAVAEPLLAGACRGLIGSEVAPVLAAPSGVDVRDYGESVLARFANPALRHTTAQVAQDGSQKTRAPPAGHGIGTARLRRRPELGGARGRGLDAARRDHRNARRPAGGRAARRARRNPSRRGEPSARRRADLRAGTRLAPGFPRLGDDDVPATRGTRRARCPRRVALTQAMPRRTGHSGEDDDRAHHAAGRLRFCQEAPGH